MTNCWPTTISYVFAPFKLENVTYEQWDEKYVKHTVKYPFSYQTKKEIKREGVLDNQDTLQRHDAKIQHALSFLEILILDLKEA